MKIYKCSWPSGTFSIVHAKDKLDAIFILDEWGGAEESMLKELKSFAMDFNFNPEAVAEGIKVEVEDGEDYFDRTSLYRWHMSERTAEGIEILSAREVADRLAEEEKTRAADEAEWKASRSVPSILIHPQK